MLSARGRLEPDEEPDRTVYPLTIYSQWISRRAMRERNANADAVAAMLPDFNFPSRGAQLWTAMRFVPADVVDRNNNYLQAIGRLRRDVSLDAARTEMSVLAGRLQQQYPRENDEIGASVIRLRDGVSPQSRTLLVTLFAAAACVLLIACANLTNLLLARAIGRRREMAVRMALGAGRERVLRQLLTESLVVTSTGGVLGLAVAAATLPIRSRLVPTALPIAETPTMDLRVVAFAMALTMVTGVGFGICRCSSTIAIARVRACARARAAAEVAASGCAAPWLSPRSPPRSSCS
jgi:hypothetical protein